jgi:hypothetical protein
MAQLQVCNCRCTLSRTRLLAIGKIASLTRPLSSVTLVSIYIPNRVTQSVLLHPIRNNISSSVQQLVDVARARALPMDAQQVLEANRCEMIRTMTAIIY